MFKGVFNINNSHAELSHGIARYNGNGRGNCKSTGKIVLLLAFKKCD